MGTRIDMTALAQRLGALFAPITSARVAVDGVVVGTTTIYGNGDAVSVEVRPRAGGAYEVSDGGAARAVLFGAGFTDIGRGETRRANDIAAAASLNFDRQAFSVIVEDDTQIPAAIMYVARASSRWADSVIETRSAALEEGLVGALMERLTRFAPGKTIERAVDIAGASTKKHQFDAMLSLSRERKALFKIVTPFAASISSAHLKLFDVHKAHEDWVLDSVVEHMADWDAADLNLLSDVSSHVRSLDQDWPDLPKIAA